MTWWKVSTTEKKCVFEHELWHQDSGPSADAVDMYYTEYNYELDSLDDGWYGDVIWPDDMPEEERERLEEIWDEDWSAGWENEGWDQYDTECWFHGPLSIEKDGE
jgi:hypothetical protein